jgi:hypothetical protein
VTDDPARWDEPWRRRLRWQRRVFAVLGTFSVVGLVILPAVVPDRYPSRAVPVLAFFTGIGLGGAVVLLVLQDVIYTLLDRLGRGIRNAASSLNFGDGAAQPTSRPTSSEDEVSAPISQVDRLKRWLAEHPNVTDLMTNGVSPAVTGLLCAVVGAAATLGAVALT